MSKVILLDFGMYLHIAVYASANNPPVSATYTCLNMIISSLKKIGVNKGDKIIVAVDGRHSWRKDLDKNYKANRKAGREKSGIDWNKEFENMNWLLEQIDIATDWNVLVENSIEADDIMSVATRVFIDNEIILSTFDSDMEQLWEYDNVKIFSPKRKCVGKQGKGAYKIKPKNFNVYHFLSKKIVKEQSDNLISPILNQQDYEKRMIMINLLELPDHIENTLKEKLENLPEKELNIEAIPFKSIKERYMSIYNSDKIITYSDSMKEKRKKVKK